LLAGNASEAEDVVQEAYLSAHRYFSSFQGGDMRPWLLAIAVMAVLTAVGIAASVLSLKSRRRCLEGVCICALWAVMTVLTVVSGFWLSSDPAWDLAGPVLLFFGLLIWLNAPFDWLSIGLTRALLRRGVELQTWWPYGLAFVDAALALVIVFLLAGRLAS
jgi:Sigma-70 region 2